MSHDANLVPQLATLARLSLSPAEEAAFSEQIPKIIAYVDQLKDVEPTTSSAEDDQALVPRLDVVAPSTAADAILEQAPAKVDRLWKVPPVK